MSQFGGLTICERRQASHGQREPCMSNVWFPQYLAPDILVIVLHRFPQRGYCVRRYVSQSTDGSSTP